MKQDASLLRPMRDPEPEAPRAEAAGAAAVASAEPAGPPGLFARVTAFRERHATAEIALFFVGGFLYDVLTVDRIDDLLTLLQQGAFLVLLAVLLVLDQRFELRAVEPKGLLGKAWPLRETAVHFLFGSLLSAYTVLYFRSASGVLPLLFLAGLFGLLVANELPRFRGLGPVVRVALFAFSIATFFAYLLPVVFGFMSAWLFVLANAVAAGAVWGLTRLVRRFGGDARLARRRVLVPGGAVVGALLLLYFVGAVPPVPLSLRDLGIYHRVERDAEGFHLYHEPVGWRLWRQGDQRFLARPGDRVYVFTRIFAPTEFKGRVVIRWAFRDPKRGWVSSDAIPLSIVGGRGEGYRGYAYKRNWHVGAWRVDVETGDGRVLGRIPFDVVDDPRGDARVFLIEDG